eukprot:CAMPEP_0182495602 /NCGR_PEP_ID=MMETSP1321-20130603/4372_1 /TAXON_ID=91990 /ORGANISM="Bolidomonas sp., Strain RCC1657" /LENGTH=234 /DNA_ID=CAMNT_0024699025 /DNA_START=96 /DNA_END=800 /DNA_ORIENTATION=+
MSAISMHQNSASPSRESVDEEISTLRSRLEYLELLVAKQDGRAGVRGNPNSGSIDAAPSSLLIKAEFNHLARECIDAEVTADFYCDILGFRRIPRPDFEDEENGKPVSGAWLHGHGLNLHLIQTNNVPFRITLLGERVKHFYANWPSVDHFAFVCKDFEEKEEMLRARKVQCKRFGGEDSKAGITQLMLLDPDGNVVELSDCAPPVGEVHCSREGKCKEKKDNENLRRDELIYI